MALRPTVGVSRVLDQNVFGQFSSASGILPVNIILQQLLGVIIVGLTIEVIQGVGRVERPNTFKLMFSGEILSSSCEELTPFVLHLCGGILLF